MYASTSKIGTEEDRSGPRTKRGFDQTAKGKISDSEIMDVVSKTDLDNDNFHHLYINLGISNVDIALAIAKANTPDFTRQARQVLLDWRAKKAEAATTSAILDALNDAKLINAKHILEYEIWAINMIKAKRTPHPRPSEVEESSSDDSDDDKPDTECCYPMKQKSHGICFIINNYKFHKESKLAERPGSRKDAGDLEKTFGDLGFEVRVKPNLTKAEMEERLQALAVENNERKPDCFVCCILSHGVLVESNNLSKDFVYAADGQKLNIFDFASLHFNAKKCPGLKGKPKVFFIQACRGSQQQEGVLEGVEHDAPRPTIPIQADFFYGYSTVYEYLSYRNPEQGSWYIQTLTKMIKKHGSQLDLLRIITRVNRELSKKENGGYKQVSSSVYTLRKDLYLK